MTVKRTLYAEGTELEMRYPFGTYAGGKAKCSDGVVRRLARIAETPDTFFSVPAAVKVNGKTVSGFVSLDTLNDSESTVLFTANVYSKNGHLLPRFGLPTADSSGDETKGE